MNMLHSERFSYAQYVTFCCLVPNFHYCLLLPIVLHAYCCFLLLVVAMHRVNCCLVLLPVSFFCLLLPVVLFAVAYLLQLAASWSSLLLCTVVYCHIMLISVACCCLVSLAVAFSAWQ